MTTDRDVRLSESELLVMIDAADRRRKELRRSIARDSGTYHNALTRKVSDLETLDVLVTKLRHNVRALQHWSGYDTWSSASRQHYIDTGRYLPADRSGDS